MCLLSTSLDSGGPPYCLPAQPLSQSASSSPRVERSLVSGGSCIQARVGCVPSHLSLALTQAAVVLFYQVIYPLKEIYPDSGELGPLGTHPPSHRLFSACWGRPPARLLVSGWVPSTTSSDWLLFWGLYPDLILFCLPPAEERHSREGRDGSHPSPALPLFIKCHHLSLRALAPILVPPPLPARPCRPLS